MIADTMPVFGTRESSKPSNGRHAGERHDPRKNTSLTSCRQDLEPPASIRGTIDGSAISPYSGIRQMARTGCSSMAFERPCDFSIQELVDDGVTVDAFLIDQYAS